jgi:hypothetical protein
MDTRSLLLGRRRLICLAPRYAHFSAPAGTLSRLAMRDDTTVSPDDQYGYVPSEAVAILFLALFGISTGDDFFTSLL